MGWSFKDWYQRNSEALLAERRRRYADDSEYREKQKAWSRDYNERYRKSRPLLEKAPFIRRPISILVCHGGVWRKHACWSIGAVEGILGKRKRFVSDAERRGILPRTGLQSKGARYYTTGMVDVIVYLSGVEGWSKDLCGYVSSGWDALDEWSYIVSGEYSVVPFSMRVIIDGDPTEVFGTDYLALQVCRTEQQVMEWEDVGKLPKTPLRFDRERLYTKEMVDCISHAVGGAVRVTRETLDPVHRAWSGILGKIGRLDD